MLVPDFTNCPISGDVTGVTGIRFAKRRIDLAKLLFDAFGHFIGMAGVL